MRKNLNERSAKLLEEGQQIKQAEDSGKPWNRRKINKWKTVRLFVQLPVCLATI